MLTPEQLQEARNKFGVKPTPPSADKVSRMTSTWAAADKAIEDKKPLSFGERLKMSFGDKGTIEELKRKEEEAGLRGKFDIGDIADVAGSAIPAIGGVLGGLGGTIAGFGVGGVPGAAIGTGAGEAVKQAIGRGLGVREDQTIGEEVKDVGKTVAFTYLAGKAGQYLLSRVPKLLGIATGEGDDTIRLALKNPKVADAGIKSGDSALREAVSVGSKKSVALRDAFVKGHQEAFKKLAGQNSEALVPPKKILYDFADMIGKNGIKIKDGILDFSTSKIKANPGEISKINAAYEAVQNWDDFSLVGVNKLKQLVGALTKFPSEAGGTSKSPFLGKVYHYLDETIKNNLDDSSKQAYSEMNKKFAENIDLYDEMVDAFNSGDPFTKLANSLGKNKDTLRQVLDFYEGQSGEKVLPIVAGRELGMEKNAAFGILNPRSWIDFFISPEVQAKGITRLGKMSNPIEAGLKSVYQAGQKAIGVDPTRQIRLK